MPEATFVAVNSAPDSPNRIHSDEGARAAGFPGGLLPGYDVFTYACDAVRQQSSVQQTLTGFMRLRYKSPFFEGDAVTVTLSDEPDNGGRVSVSNSRVDEAAVGIYAMTDVGHYAGSRPALQPNRPANARPVPLLHGQLLSLDSMLTVEVEAEPKKYLAWLDLLGIDVAPYEQSGFVPLGFYPWTVTEVIHTNFQTMQGFHAGTELQSLRPVRAGEVFSVRSRVDRVFNRNGKTFFVWEIGWFASNGEPAAWLLHTVNYHEQTG